MVEVFLVASSRYRWVRSRSDSAGPASGHSRETSARESRSLRFIVASLSRVRGGPPSPRLRRARLAARGLPTGVPREPWGGRSEVPPPVEGGLGGGGGGGLEPAGPGG